MSSSYVEMQQARQVSLDGRWPGLGEPAGVEVEPETLATFGSALWGELDGADQVSPETLLLPYATH